MEPNVCRDTLATLIAQETHALGKLAELLDREHAHLVANDVAALEAAMAERQIYVGELVRVEEERRSLCRMLGHTADLPGLASMLIWCDPSGSLQSRWAECASRGARCRDLNDRNGALVHARLKRVQTLLDALTGQAPEGTTYGPAGAYAAHSAGRVLSAEA